MLALRIVCNDFNFALGFFSFFIHPLHHKIYYKQWALNNLCTDPNKLRYTVVFY